MKAGNFLQSIPLLAAGMALIIATNAASPQEKPPPAQPEPQAAQAREDADALSKDWRPLPLIYQSRVDPYWVHIGFGGFEVDQDTLRTKCDPKGMGLLVYQRQKFGDCQIRIVYRTKEAKSNSGIFVRIDDGILDRVDERPAPARRTRAGTLMEGELEKMMQASEKDQGPWYAVHHGYEVQICDDADEYHRTGAIYSLAKAEPVGEIPAEEWRTMIITLQGNILRVEVDGRPVSTFDPASPRVPNNREWYEPKREPKRPLTGYIGLQNHDPGDIVYFREVSVRPLSAKPSP